MAKKKDKILPIKVWLDEESCWNNQPQYSKGYVEYVREDYHSQAILHVLQKGVKQGKKEILDKACKCLKANFVELYLHYMRGASEDEIVYEFREYLKKAMEEE